MKRKRSKAEREHLDRVAELGCCICQMPAECHHILRGRYGTGMKTSDYEVIPLCPNHHRHGGPGVAIHNGILSWEKNYGSEKHYLNAVMGALGA